MRIVAAAEIKVAHVKLNEGTRQSARGLRVTCDGIMKPDSRRRRNMPQNAEPTRDPSREGSTPRLGNHGRPEIWPATGWICAANL